MVSTPFMLDQLYAIGTLLVVKDPGSHIHLVDGESGNTIGQLSRKPTKINMKGLKFDIGCFRDMILLACGDADGWLSIYSLLNQVCLQRQNLGFPDIAVMQVNFTACGQRIICCLENGVVLLTKLEISHELN